MSIEAVGSGQGATAASATGASKTVAGGIMGKEQFLNLLVTQLKNQDPLQPTDAQAMVAQLAQFSSLEQMQNLNTQVESLRRDGAMMQSQQLSGRNVRIGLANGETIEGVVDKILWAKGALSLGVNGQEVATSDIADIVPVN